VNADQTDTGQAMEALIAALAALARDDQTGAELALLHVDPTVVGGLAVAMLAELAPLAVGDRDLWLATLATWQPGEGIGAALVRAAKAKAGEEGDGP
jgi:hypothetical protein